MNEIEKVINLVKENNERNNVEIITTLLALKIKLEQLEKENIALKHDYDFWCKAVESANLPKLMCEIGKLKNVIEILKDKTNLKIETNAQNNPFITYDLWGSSAISKKEYKLLKEVLE